MRNFGLAHAASSCAGMARHLGIDALVFCGPGPTPQGKPSRIEFDHPSKEALWKSSSCLTWMLSSVPSACNATLSLANRPNAIIFHHAKAKGRVDHFRDLTTPPPPPHTFSLDSLSPQCVLSRQHPEKKSGKLCSPNSFPPNGLDG